MNNNYEFKSDKYDIIGFNLSQNVEQYDFEYKLGDLKELSWGFNINGKLVGVSSYGNYPLDNHSATVIDDEFFILSDFDLYKINLVNNKCELHVDLDKYYPMNEIHQFNKGVLLVGEAEIVYVENGNIKWEYYNHDNFIYGATADCYNDYIEVEIEQAHGYNFHVTLNKDGKEIS